MRKEFSQWAENRGRTYSDFIFLTGDLGFNALEGVQEAMGPRFLNAGVSEQNMISMAAALAHQGLSPLCYSIAPFAVFRPAEQIRVDLCLHNMNVKIVGNGGGYGYGIMGPTHHAIEDIGVLSGFPKMKCFIPFCNSAVASVADEMMNYKGPSYLRLGYGVAPDTIESFDIYHSIQKIKSGNNLTIIGLGPIILNALQAIDELEQSADCFVINELPIPELSKTLRDSILKTSKVLVIEEHVSRGGLAEHLAFHLCKMAIAPKIFVSHSAQGYPSGLSGNQVFHQTESGLDKESIKRTLVRLFNS